MRGGKILANKRINTVFTDCFKTIIIRKIKSKEVFKQWAKNISEKYNINWKYFYKTYKTINFNLCFKKLLFKFTLQEKFEVVLNKTCNKIIKKHKDINFNQFFEDAKETYIQTELQNFDVNTKMINLLEESKKNGMAIYLVSDFYCGSDTIKYWFDQLNLTHFFNEIFSSCDFNKEKATGKLYKFLLKKLNLNAKSVKMYGDNIWSDIFMAKLFRINTQKV